MINLLPAQYKEELRQEENWKITSILGILFLFFLISLILILFSIKIYLQGQIESQKILVQAVRLEKPLSNGADLEEKINSAQQNISKLSSFYQKEIYPSEILEKISQILPAPIYLTNFSWNKETSQITLSGFSPTREILFQFKKNLEEKKEFTDIYFPAQNWIKSTDIDFNANVQYKP